MQRYGIFFYFCKLLYMFRVDPAPIIRSNTLDLQHLVFVRPLLLLAAIVEELEQFFYFCKLLYMFRVDPAPIIRSTTLDLQHLVFIRPLLLPAAIVEELEHSFFLSL